MVIHQSNKVWNVNGTYTLQDIANQHIKPQQQIHLQNFKTIGEASPGLYKIDPEKEMKYFLKKYRGKTYQQNIFKCVFNTNTRSKG